MRRLIVALVLAAGGSVPDAADAESARGRRDPQAAALVRTYPGLAPCDTTLQACVSASNHGDAVSVLAGAYVTDTLIITRAIVLQGAGAALSSLQASSGRVISVSTSLTRTVVISGLRVMGGQADSGGGILSGPNALHLENAEIVTNTATSSLGMGGGLRATGAAVITNTLFAGNIGAGDGGGAQFGMTATLVGGQFFSNTTGSGGSGVGGGARFDGPVTVSGTVFARNGAVSDGGGAVFWSAPSTLTNTQFLTNTAGNNAGGAFFNLTATVASSSFISNFASGATGNGGGARFDGSATVLDATFERNFARWDGGGAYFYGSVSSSSLVSGSRFISNTQSGASFYYWAQVIGSDFVGNSAAVGGGLNAGAIAITRTRILDNRSTAGGAGGNFSNWSSLEDVSFERNVAAGPYANGGAAYFGTTTLLNRVFFTRNQILSDDGAYFGYGGGAFFYEPATVFGGGFFSNTTTRNGGGLAAQKELTVARATLAFNTAGQGGGALLGQAGAYDISSLVANNLFDRNRATTQVGAQILFDMPLAQARVLHNTLIGDATSPGSAIAVRKSNVAITNTIIVSHTFAITRTGAEGSLREDYNLFFGNGANLSGAITSGGNSITATPGFAGATTGNYRLSAASPARNAGTAVGIPFDFEGDSRSQPDIGYDEYVPPPFAAYLPQVGR